MRCPACTVLLTPEVPCSARSCGWETDTGEVPLPCVHVKLLCLFQVVVGSWLDLFRSVYCDQVAPSGGECRPRGVYRGLRSPAAFAGPTGRVYATATAPTVSLCLVPPAAPVLPVSGYAYVAPVPNRVYHCRYVAGSWVFRVRSLDTVQLDTDTGEQYNIGSQIPLQ